MGVDLTLIKDVSFYSRGRLLLKSTTGPNVRISSRAWGAQPQLIHLQHGACTNGAEAIWKMKAPEDRKLCREIVFSVYGG